MFGFGIIMKRVFPVIISILLIITSIVIRLEIPSKRPEQYKMGILRHAPIDTAEQKLIDIAHSHGYPIEIINPLDLTLDAKGALSEYDVIISRAEIDNFTDNITDAYLRALDYFAQAGIPVINSASSTLNAQDKFRTLLLAQQVGIPIPSTFVVHEQQRIQELLDRNKIQYPFVVKGLYGGCGESVFFVKNEDELNTVLNRNFRAGNPILIQERVDLETNEFGELRDMRIWVARDPDTNKARFVGGVYRNAQHGSLLTNLHANGSITPMESYEKDVIEISEKALDAINADVAGIDLARDKNGCLFLLEVNISFHTSQKTCEVVGVSVWEQVIDLAQSRADRAKKNRLHRRNN